MERTNTTEGHLPLSREELRGAADALEQSARVFSERPTDASVGAMRKIAGALGYEDLDEFEMSPEVDERFDERLAVPTSALFVPLRASAILQASENGGKVTYGPLRGRASDWVTRCYHATGFEGDAARVSLDSLLPLADDSLPVELLFVASLLGSAADIAAEDRVEAAARLRLAHEFVSGHLLKWLARASSYLERRSHDFYAACAAFVLQLLAELDAAIVETPDD